MGVIACLMGVVVGILAGQPIIAGVFLVMAFVANYTVEKQRSSQTQEELNRSTGMGVVIVLALVAILVIFGLAMGSAPFLADDSVLRALLEP